MKIYANGDAPKVDAHNEWKDWTFETPDEYTLVCTSKGALDIRKSPKGDIAVFVPGSKTVEVEGYKNDVLRVQEYQEVTTEAERGNTI